MDGIEQTLFLDPQAAIPAGFCPVCGAEVYLPDRDCLRCRNKMP